MAARDHLRVWVNDELVLDAGTCQEAPGPDGPERTIVPPTTTLFHQVLAYLREKPDPSKRPSGSIVGREGVAAAAMVLRWGSYLAVLLDRNKPLWPDVHLPGTSRISDDEIARINIEASASLAEWIDLYRADSGGPSYTELVDRAVYYLPMPKKTTKPKVIEFGALAEPEFAARFVRAAESASVDSTRVNRVRGDAQRYPTRLLANALINTAWRNGPIEDIHAGNFRSAPLDQRRVTPREERVLLSFASERLALGMTVCQRLSMERSRRTWSEQVLPYGLAETWLITPSRWSLTETSREVRLPMWAATLGAQGSGLL
jgi:hypothetical protein